MRGGLGHVNIIGSVIFSGMSGTAIADAAGLGTIEIKAMKDHGYSTEFSVGVTAASATLGPIIPPSLPFVIYGMMANVSIGALFLGGVIPGVVMTLLMMVTVAYFAHKNGWGSDSPFSWSQLGSAAVEIAIVLGQDRRQSHLRHYRIRFGAGGICGSDMHYFRHARTGDFVVTSPLILGHEIAGEIVEIAGVAPGLKVGDRVAVNPLRSA